MADLTLPMTPPIAPKAPSIIGSESDLVAHSDSPKFHTVADAAVEALRSARTRNSDRRDRDARAERRPQHPTTRRPSPAGHRATQKKDSTRSDSTTGAKKSDDTAKTASDDTTATASTTGTTATANTATTAGDSTAPVAGTAVDVAAALAAAAIAAASITAAPDIDPASASVPGVTDATTTAAGPVALATAATTTTATTTTSTATPTIGSGTKATATVPANAAIGDVADPTKKESPHAGTGAGGDNATSQHSQTPTAGVEHVAPATPVLIAGDAPISATVPTTNPAAAAALSVQPASSTGATAMTTATPGGARLDAAEQVEANSNALRVVSGARLLHHSVDGPSTMTVTLEPAHLGQVRIDMTLQDGVLSVRLTAQHSAGAQSLQKALPALHAELEADGLHLADLGVGLGAGNGHGADGDRSSSSDARRGIDQDRGAAGATTALRGRRNAAVDPLTTMRRANPAGRFDLDL